MTISLIFPYKRISMFLWRKRKRCQLEKRTLSGVVNCEHQGPVVPSMVNELVNDKLVNCCGYSHFFQQKIVYLPYFKAEILTSL